MADKNRKRGDINRKRGDWGNSRMSEGKIVGRRNSRMSVGKVVGRGNSRMSVGKVVGRGNSTMSVGKVVGRGNSRMSIEYGCRLMRNPKNVRAHRAISCTPLSLERKVSETGTGARKLVI